MLARIQVPPLPDTLGDNGTSVARRGVNFDVAHVSAGFVLQEAPRVKKADEHAFDDDARVENRSAV